MIIDVSGQSFCRTRDLARQERTLPVVPAMSRSLVPLQPSRVADTTIVVNIYDVVEHPFNYRLAKWMSLGIHHSGIQVGMREFAFTLEGIVVTEPHRIPRCKLTQRVVLTHDATEPMLQGVLEKLQRDFTPQTYDPLTLNCNSFTDAFCQCLGTRLPSWVNRAPNIAQALGAKFQLRPPIITAPSLEWSRLLAETAEDDTESVDEYCVFIPPSPGKHSIPPARATSHICEAIAFAESDQCITCGEDPRICQSKGQLHSPVAEIPPSPLNAARIIPVMPPVQRTSATVRNTQLQPQIAEFPQSPDSAGRVIAIMAPKQCSSIMVSKAQSQGQEVAEFPESPANAGRVIPVMAPEQCSSTQEVVKKGDGARREKHEIMLTPESWADSLTCIASSAPLAQHHQRKAGYVAFPAGISKLVNHEKVTEASTITIDYDSDPNTRHGGNLRLTVTDIPP